MEISVSPELEEYVAGKVASGSYSSPSEVFVAGLEALRAEEQELIDEVGLAQFNEELRDRLESLDRGEFVDPETVRARILRKSELRKPHSA